MGDANISGKRIKQARERMGWDQNELAAALQVDFQIKLEQSDTAVCVFMRDSSSSVQTNCEGEQD